MCLLESTLLSEILRKITIDTNTDTGYKCLDL